MVARYHVSFLTVLALIPVMVPDVGLAQRYWDGGAGTNRSWLNATNWSGNTVPTSTDDAYVGSATLQVTTATVSRVTGVCRRLTVGDGGGTTGRVHVTTGHLAMAECLYLGNTGYGTLEQDGGTCTVVVTAYIGNQVSSSGRYILRNGARLITKDLTLCKNAGSRGLVDQGENTSVIVTSAVTIGSADAGTYLLDRAFMGTSNVPAVDPAFRVGNAANGARSLYWQRGGTNRVAGNIRIAEMQRTRGTMILTNRAVLKAGALTVAWYGTGSLEQVDGSMVHLQGGLTIAMRGSGPAWGDYLQLGGILTGAVSMTVCAESGARGFYRGWGTNALGGAFTMNGLTVADGRGAAHDLVITNYSSLANSIANGTTQTNGWFARNKGRLVLKRVPSAATMLWGESGSDVDLVNAVKIVLTGYGGSGSLQGSLYAPDHPSVPPYRSGAAPAGIWRLEADGFTFASVRLSFRYDHVQAAARGIENDLQVYAHTGATWDRWESVALQGLDTVNKRIVASNVTSLAWFAIGHNLPVFHGTVFMVL